MALVVLVVLIVLVVLLLFVHMQKAYLVSVGLYWQM